MYKDLTRYCGVFTVIIFLNTLCVDTVLSQTENGEISQQALKKAIEQLASPEQLKRLKQNPEEYKKFVDMLKSQNPAFFLRKEIVDMVGEKTIYSWGGFLTHPYSSENLDMLLRWRDNEDPKLQHTVYSILQLMIEDRSTPIEIVEKKLQPVMQETLNSSDISDRVKTKCRRGLLAAKWRTWLRSGDAANNLATSSTDVSFQYVAKLLSLTATSQAVKILEQRKDELEYGQQIFVDVAKLNVTLSSNSASKPRVLYQSILDDTKTTKARIYAAWKLWRFVSHHAPGKRKLIYRAHRKLPAGAPKTLIKKMESINHLCESLDRNKKLTVGIVQEKLQQIKNSTGEVWQSKELNADNLQNKITNIREGLARFRNKGNIAILTDILRGMVVLTSSYKKLQEQQQRLAVRKELAGFGLETLETVNSKVKKKVDDGSGAAETQEEREDGTAEDKERDNKNYNPHDLQVLQEVILQRMERFLADAYSTKSRDLEALQKLLDNSNISDEQKRIIKQNTQKALQNAK